MTNHVKAATAAKTSGAMERTLRELKALIINGGLSPGEQIRQQEMAEQLHVSRVPLREAMNVLADQGLLSHRPHQGYFVVKRAPAERAQITRMLQLLETELMQTMAWPDAQTLALLRGLNDEMRDCVGEGDVGRLIETNRQFHLRIFSLSPNHLILEQVRRLWSMAEPYMWSKFDRAQDRKKTLVEHERLLDALAARDRARCVAELEQHRTSGRAEVPLPGSEEDLPANAPAA